MGKHEEEIPLTATKKPAWAEIDLKGQKYTLVSWRLHEFREDYPVGYGRIRTDLEGVGTGDVLLCKARIQVRDDLGKGFEEAARAHASGSADPAGLPKLETKAVGRALAFLGYGGRYIASAEEMEAYEEGQRVAEILRYQELWREYALEVSNCKAMLAHAQEAFAKGDVEEAAKAVQSAKNTFAADVDRDAQMTLWRAPSKGGCWTTEERTLLKEGIRVQ